MKTVSQKKTENVRKHKNAFSALLAVFLICLFAVPFGLYLADGYVDKYFTAEPPATEELVDDVSEIVYDGKAPSKLSAVDTFLVASKILDESNYYKITTKGTIDAQITSQSVNGSFVKDGNTYTNESYSDGMVKVATKSVYVDGGDVQMYEGKESPDKTSYAWNNKNSVSVDYYKSYYGKIATSNWSYIVSSKTVLESSSCVEEDGLFTYTISLDPQTSTILYKNQIRTNSGLKNDPVFKSIIITFTVDENYAFKSIKIAETYTMNYVGVNITVSSAESPLISTFSYEK